MANKKITDLVDIGTPASGDLLEIVDISEGVSKRVAVSALGGSTPTLQEVTDAGNTILDNDIIFNNTGNDFETTINEFSDGGIYLRSVVNDTLTTIGAGVIYLGDIDGSDSVVITKDAILVDSVSYLFPVGASSPLATLDDIPPAITIDATPTDGSANAVSSNGVFDALALKQDVVSGVSDTEIGYLDGVTSAIQTQINAKFTLPTLTSGSVLFSNGSTIAQDNANLFWDDTNYSLGIGTNAPTAKLDVFGSSSNFALHVLNTSTGAVGGTETFLAENTSPNGQAAFIFKGNRTGYNSYGGMIYGGSTQVTGGLFGTTNRQDKLFFFADGTSNLGLYVGTLNSQPFIIGTSNAERMRITSTGQVAIGATTAGARLDVRAQGALSTDIAFRVRNSADSANLLMVQGNGNIGIGVNSTSERLHISQTVSGSNNVLRMSSSGSNANIITFRNADASIQGGFLGTGSTFSFGTYISNQCNLIGGAGGLGFRVTNAANINLYGGNADADFGVNYFRLFGATGNVQIQNGGTYTDIASARLAVNSTTQGFLPPRMTNAQRLAIASPAVGLIVYCTDATEGLYVNKSGGWTFII